MKKAAIFISLLFALSLPLVFQHVSHETLKLKTFDAFIPEKNATGYFSILNITEEDVVAEGGYPFPRSRLAEIQRDLYDRGALGVGWVIAFTEADRFGGDYEFASSLKLLPSVLSTFENNSADFPKTTGTVILGENISGIKAKGVRENIDILSKHAGQGIASAPVDVDNLVRQIPLLMQTPDGWVASFGTEVLKTLAQQDTYIIKGSEAGIEEIAVRGIPPTQLDKYGRQWISWVDTPQTTLQEMDVQNKFVFMGVTASGVMPQIATPVGLLEPHKIQAALAESILMENSPYIPDWHLAAELTIFLFLSTITWLLINFLGITWGLALTATAHIAALETGRTLITKGILIDITWSLISAFIIGSAAFYLRFREQYKLRQQIKKQFEHYLDPRQVKELQKNPDLLKLGGQKRVCTFLFTDLRGFTALSEKVTPEEVTEIMNRVLTAQQKSVQAFGGMVDKYIGDAMMAIFNAPLDLQNHSRVAVDCAVDIKRRIIELNHELKNEGKPSIAIGIGINSGEAIIGNMGSESRFDYTAIGDAVNVAARLESATKERNVDLLIGKQTERYCGYHLKPLEPIIVKGKSEPLQIFTWKDRQYLKK